jgi:hypothetical protein
VAIGAQAAAWIKRVEDGGEAERAKLAEELRISREEERRKRLEEQEAENAK